MKKAAVIGFGFMGVIHAKNIFASKNLELCAIVDNRDDIFKGIENTGNHGNLNLPLKQLRQVPVFKTLKECVDKVHPEAVIICVPLFLHYEMTREALKLGLDVLLEKPFCPEVSQCNELIALANDRKRILMVAHCIRFAPEWEFLAKCIKDKRYGKLKLLSTTRICGEPAWGVWLDEKIKKTCGGSLFDLLIHDIDFANSCLGSSQDISRNVNMEEYWELGLKYEAPPAMVSIKGGFLYRNTPFTSDCIATFEHGSIRFSTLKPEIIQVAIDSESKNVEMSGDMYANELEYFAECIIERNEPEKCPVEHSMLAIELCNEIKRLSKTKASLRSFK